MKYWYSQITNVTTMHHVNMLIDQKKTSSFTDHMN